MSAALDAGRPSTTKRRLRTLSGWLAIVGLGWAGWLVFAGGVDIPIGRFTITSNEPMRPLYVGVAALLAYVWLAGATRWIERWRSQTARVPPDAAAVVLTAGVFVLGTVYGATVVTGSDAYGYLSQADLWIEGDLKVEQPWVDVVPWRNAPWTFAYLGYRPVGEPGARAVVPSYSPGLPILMAAAKITGGHGAAFLVLPVSGALLVWLTFGLGRRLDSPGTGLMAAVLVASSPAFLLMMMLPMSDVPAAAAWAAAAYFVLGTRVTSAATAGLSAALAIAIRPNLVFLVGVLGLWFVIEAIRTRSTFRLQVARAAVFSAGSLLGVGFIAWFNDHLFGSPFTSGYGGLGGMFEMAHVGPNIRNYTGWLAETSPLALVGLGALACPLPMLWRSAGARWFAAIAALFTLGVWALYWAYLVFDTWSYLRFLLPTWPFLMIGAALVFRAIFRLERTWVTILAGMAFVFAVGAQLSYASRHYVFELGMSERHYAGVALAMRSATPEHAVVLSMQHSGTLQYYGGRTALRYDEIDREALESVVGWLESRNVPVFALLQDFEVDAFTQRFAGHRLAAELAERRVFVYDGTSVITLYRLSGEPVGTEEPPHVPGDVSHLRAVPPSPTPHPPLRLARQE